MYPHRIRLHGPWEFEPVARTVLHPDGVIESCPGPLPLSGRMRMPATWSGTPLDGFRGHVRFRRRFHRPRALEPQERLWIAFHGVDYFAEVTLNETRLGRHQGYFAPFEFEVTSLIQPFNELVVDVNCPTDLDPNRAGMLRAGLESLTPRFVAGIWRDVTLEVRSFAFLRDVAVRARRCGNGGCVVATGVACGECGSPVQLDMNVNGTVVGSKKIEIDPLGSPFTIEAELDNVD